MAKKTNPRRVGWLLIVLLLAMLSVPSAVAQEDLSKSRNRALAHSLVPTLAMPAIGIGLLAYSGKNEDVAGFAGFWIGATGLIFGPSQGHIYAERRHPFSGAAIRTGCFLVTVFGLMFGILDAMDEGDHSSTPYAMMIAGATGLVASATYDIATVGRSVNNYNQRMAAISWKLGPTVSPKSRTIGVSLSLNW